MAEATSTIGTRSRDGTRYCMGRACSREEEHGSIFSFLERKRVSTPLDSISSRWNERLRFCEERVGGETNGGGSVGKHVPRKRGKFNGSS